MNQHFKIGMSLYTKDGRRKYMNAAERERFIAAAMKADEKTKAFCLTLAHTGCRISEALELTAQSVQIEAGIISIRSLKKRDKHVIREVPVPPDYIKILDEVMHLSERGGSIPLWSWGRTWAWRQVKSVMSEAGISGIQATPKGLRHAYAIHAIQSGVPLNLVQKWLGHSELATTAIYTNAVGPEELEIAERMWWWLKR